VQNNISKSIYDKDSAHVPSNISSDENFIQSVMDQATNIVAKQTNSAANISFYLSAANISFYLTYQHHEKHIRRRYSG